MRFLTIYQYSYDWLIRALVLHWFTALLATRDRRPWSGRFGSSQRMWLASGRRPFPLSRVMVAACARSGHVRWLKFVGL